MLGYRRRGWRVLRFNPDDLVNDIESVITAILLAVRR
jgi:very-short-patch-repair endonuclease